MSYCNFKDILLLATDLKPGIYYGDSSIITLYSLKIWQSILFHNNTLSPSDKAIALESPVAILGHSLACAMEIMIFIVVDDTFCWLWNVLMSKTITTVIQV